mgnify:CR=1 FL=1
MPSAWRACVESGGEAIQRIHHAAVRHHHEHYGILMAAVFLVTDLMIYLFFRSLRLLPSRALVNLGRDRFYRIFFLWLAFCAMVAVLIRTMQKSQQPGRSVAMLSFLSGGFLLLTILGLMMLPRIGSGDIIHGRSAESTQLQPAAARLPADAAREGSAP